MYKVTIMTKQGEKTAFVNDEHKIFLITELEESADNSCRPLNLITGTQFTDIKILHSGNTMIQNLDSVVSRLSASSLDLTIELRSSEEYLAFNMEQRIQGRMVDVGLSLCKMARHALDGAEVSPFHPNSLLRVRGELVMELGCTPVRVEVRIGERRSDNCLKDTLPIWYRNEPLYIQSGTHLLVESKELSLVPCSTAFTSVFQTDEGALVQAAPEVQLVEIELTHIDGDYLHALNANGPIEHSSYGSDLLYTNEEVESFNSLIHFDRAKSHVVDAMVRKYCTTGDCGSYEPKPGDAGFDIGHLSQQVIPELVWYESLLEHLQEAGNVCSVIVVLYLIMVLLIKTLSIFIMTCNEGSNVCTAFSMHFFAQTQYTTQLAAEKRERAKRERDFKQNAFELNTPPRQNNVIVPDLTGATLGPSPVGVHYQQMPEGAHIYTQQRGFSGEGNRFVKEGKKELQEPLINYKNQTSPNPTNLYPQGISPLHNPN
jgi:hypothetical protein